ncbi:MAG: sugar phosphate isomerase/epimerase [Planctomycetota bacterium]|nr:sugar phosphate isomerase/epimerase [Planctomycetota bacterium]
MEPTRSRREFLQIASMGAAASLTGLGCSQAGVARAQDRTGRKPRFQLGMASYTLRKFDLDQALKMTRRVGLTHIALKDFHLAMDSSPEQIREVATKAKDAGLTLYGCGVVYMRNEAQVHQAFDYAKTAGMKTIIGVPNYDLLPLVNQKIKEYDIKVAIHNHGPGDKVYPLPSTAYEKVKDLDKRIGLCNDIGHTMRSGVDPSESVRRYADRLLDVHIKDVTAAEAKGSTCEIGRGVIDIPKFIRTLVEIDYAGIVSFEYEKDENDPMPGLAESVGYVRGVIASI